MGINLLDNVLCNDKRDLDIIKGIDVHFSTSGLNNTV